MLYTRTLRNIAYMNSACLPRLSMPKMDIDDTTRDAFLPALSSGYAVNYAWNSLSGANDVCNFMESGTTSIIWDGGVSPCWPLMHNHSSYLHGKEHRTSRHVIGDVNERDLLGAVDGPQLRGVSRKSPQLRFCSLHLLRRLLPFGSQRRRLPGERVPRLRLLPVVAGRYPVPLTLIEKEVILWIRRKSSSCAPATRAARKWQKLL